MRSFQLDLLVASFISLVSGFAENSLIPLLLAFRRKLVFGEGTGARNVFETCSELSEKLVLLKNYAGFTKIEIVIVTLIFSDVFHN